ncbi:MAG: acetyl-CoA carboxylase biotin carboxylase subunit [Verrucomicrobiota bacterium]|jgi:acetyl-CoA carboxylase biotin carboxylase subunit|nr:acetyl-CoA carboxylase biotin carboxylase subunit [Verrucomicrobiota bacterium]MDP6250313.1 acetyl-CoA carboxylase biotin carboxylase subunit [Verrucomicrobiota bacterium]MDP7177087.1 acetyl-CoA carboxylase biotin carboxylase subunit [Verrucomicrobiota bacterium]MDP7292446.1 acetyl-CoA carboxylase biotin carboxylase subunit [Verrucomicrobiota bacterium]MDP7441581.1 acetyl-CoA carboxylase biotin carboxylase subunit [Verrucomicrobiota bacterium]|tara:strand:+ start:1516 stop:2898 length:1383 start_codon:yes stop_codon:yes gene_type:complete
MFEKILVANRGEIAVRVIRACRELNIRTVAVYSEADSNSMHAQMADEAICIGGAASADSYLRIDRIIGAAEISDVDAVHPGYGFLSENAHFAEVCENCNIRFIGPKPAAMNALEDKALSRELARKAGVPIPPGSEDNINTEQEALKIAKKIGYPVMIKAVAGGGGRGMRTAHNDISLIKGYHTARNEAEKSFGNSGVYVEKLIENPHHIEFQILGDSKGNIIHLGERDCSVQRRNQKLVEETPSPLLEGKYKKLRLQIGKAAIKIAQAAEYTNAGTVEFIVDDKGKFYFLEVNKRIQVEHPITEEVTGVDLVKQQILVAMGEPLKLSQSDIKPTGHAIECRINAEDPWNDFRPSPGKIEMYYAPGGRGVRLDSHVYAGYTIPSHYDSMIAKLITYGTSRRDAINKMNRALDEYIVTGIKTTIPFQKAVLHDPEFCRGAYSTNLVEELLGGGRRELIQEKA